MFVTSGYKFSIKIHFVEEHREHFCVFVYLQMKTLLLK